MIDMLNYYEIKLEEYGNDLDYIKYLFEHVMPDVVMVCKLPGIEYYKHIEIVNKCVNKQELYWLNTIIYKHKDDMGYEHKYETVYEILEYNKPLHDIKNVLEKKIRRHLKTNHYYESEGKYEKESEELFELFTV